jgi:hypothetical protein
MPSAAATTGNTKFPSKKQSFEYKEKHKYVRLVVERDIVTAYVKRRQVGRVCGLETGDY